MSAPNSASISDTLQSMRDQTTRFRDVFDSWCTEQQEQIEQEQFCHRDVMKQAEESISTLVAKEAALKDLLLSQEKNTQLELIRMEEWKQQLAQVEQRLASLPPQLELVAQQQRNKQEITELKKKELEIIKSSREYRVAILMKGVEYFRSRLGLDLRVTNDSRLKFTFTKINPANPAQEYSFAVVVDETEQYNVSDCQPEIADLPTLVKQLNDSNDFSAFVQAMRRNFKAMV